MREFGGIGFRALATDSPLLARFGLIDRCCSGLSGRHAQRGSQFVGQGEDSDREGSLFFGSEFAFCYGTCTPHQLGLHRHRDYSTATRCR
jgi:hypothetical protein